MRLSGSYFKKMDNLAKWIFRRDKNNQDNPEQSESSKKKHIKEPQTQNEGKVRSYVEFQNEGGEDSNEANCSGIAMNRQIKSYKEHNTKGSEYFIKKHEQKSSFQKQTCTICLDADSNSVLMDCGHGAICFNCALTILNTTCECPLCRNPVVQVLRIDTSFQSDDLLKVIEAVDLHNIEKYNRICNVLHTSGI